MSIELTKSQQKDLKAGHAKLLACAHCGKVTYFGAMNLLSLAIGDHKPVCSYDCNKALGQVK